MTSPGPRSRSRTKASPATPPADQAEDSSSKTSPLFLPPEDLPPGLPPQHQPAGPEMPPAPPSSMTDPSADVPVVGSPSVTPSTDSKPTPKVTRGSIRKYAKLVVAAAGKYAQQRLTLPDSPERAAGL